MGTTEGPPYCLYNPIMSSIRWFTLCTSNLFRASVRLASAIR